MRPTTFALFLFILPMVLAQSYTIGTVTTARPIIVINYFERPILIDEYWLNYTAAPTQLNNAGITYTTERCGQAQSGPTETDCAGQHFNFTTKEFLWDEDYTFYAKAHDSDGNELDFRITFTVDAKDTDYLFYTPAVRFDQSRKAAMGTSATFEATLGVNPEYPLTSCYYTFPDVLVIPGYDLHTPTEQLFNYLTLLGKPLTPPLATQTGGHYYKQLSANLNSFPGRDHYTEGDLVQAYILCKDENRFHPGVLWIGYDTTKPKITETQTPRTIIDPQEYTASMKILTDDKTVCTIENTAYPAGHRKLLPNPTYTSLDNYTKEKYYTINYFDVLQNQGACWDTVCTYKYSITCENMAGQTQDETSTLTIKLDHTLSVEIATPDYVQSKSFLLNATTRITAQCTYAVEGTSVTGIMQGHKVKQGYYHTAQVTYPEEKAYKVKVTCVAEKQASKTKRIGIDKDQPLMTNVTINEPYCGEGPLKATIRGFDNTSGVDYYEYQLSSGNKPLTNWTKTSREAVNEPLDNPPKSITLTAKVYDKSGRVSATKADTTQHHNESELICDTTAPTTSYNASIRAGTYRVTIFCSDESGCENVIRTYETNIEGTCPKHYENYTGPQRAVNTTFSLTTAKRICWYVTDKAGNKQAKYADIDQGIEDCTNGEKDADEDGIDCGGICPSACVCGNGVIDPGEECDGQTALLCDSFNMTGTATSCTDYCTIDTAQCSGAAGTCGDGAINPGETCDGLLTITMCNQLWPSLQGNVSCADTCHLDTTLCRLVIGACEKQSDCPDGKICSAGVCKTPDEDDDVDNDGLPDYWELQYFTTINDYGAEDDPDRDGSSNINEYYKGTNPTIADQTSGSRSSLGLIVLIIGVFFILAGAGYLIYEQYFTGKKKIITPPTPLTVQSVEEPQISEEERRRKEEEKKELQQQARAQKLKEKEKRRKELISSFRPDMTKNQALGQIAQASGKPVSEVRKAFTKESSPEHISGLFKDTATITAKDVTPAFKHLISKGHIEQDTVHQAIGELHKDQKITDKQKEKILRELS